MNYEENGRRVILEVNDIMVTKPCSVCDQDVLLKRSETMCMACKEIRGIKV